MEKDIFPFLPASTARLQKGTQEVTVRIEGILANTFDKVIIAFPTVVWSPHLAATERIAGHVDRCVFENGEDTP